MIMFELNVHHLTSRIDPYSANHSISFGNNARVVSVGSIPLPQLVLLASLLVMVSAIISNMKIKAFCKCSIYVYEYFLYIRDWRNFYIRLSLKKEARMFSQKKVAHPSIIGPYNVQRPPTPNTRPNCSCKDLLTSSAKWPRWLIEKQATLDIRTKRFLFRTS